MKAFLSILSILISTLCLSQVSTFQTVNVDSGKYEFKLQAKKDTPDYSVAYRILINQIRLNPKNAELRYFLGYAIDRLNADDGERMCQSNKELTIKASEQFEEVNKLEPIYQGEIFILDPYSKLGAIWGSLAQAYLYRKLIDSAKWAFLEGKKRGGFIEPILSLNRQMLNSCAKNAILFTYGDDITISMWYLQTIENYRTDITIVDASLIGTSWYPKYLKNERNLKISFPDSLLDTLGYIKWSPQIVEIADPTDSVKKFSWELRPTYGNEYILRNDRILLEILKQNFFSRPIYFNSNSDSSYNLFLSPYLKDEGLVNRVSNKIVDYKADIFSVSKNLYDYNIDSLKKEDILKSQDAISILNYIRWAYFTNIYNLTTQGNYHAAKLLIKLMDDKFKKDKLPFVSDEVEKYFIDFFMKIDKDSP